MDANDHSNVMVKHGECAKVHLLLSKLNLIEIQNMTLSGE